MGFHHIHISWRGVGVGVGGRAEEKPHASFPQLLLDPLARAVGEFSHWFFSGWEDRGILSTS